MQVAVIFLLHQIIISELNAKANGREQQFIMGDEIGAKKNDARAQYPSGNRVEATVHAALTLCS